ncbi:MAG: ABC transporter ATP-binding protein [Myxococcota bacterium]
MDTLLEVREVVAGYGPHEVLRAVSFAVREGELWAVLGPNGAGKSTLLRALAGLLPLRGGEVALAGRALRSYGRRELAQTVAWVPQATEAESGFTGLELALLGRSPHLGFGGLPSGGDVARARAALEEMGVGHLAARSTAEVSGGERRLFWLARALVQSPRVLFLDEPTAFLDVRHQVRSLERVRAYVTKGAAAVAVLHDVNLAAAFADQVVLLREGKVLAQGEARKVLTGELLEELFDVPMTGADAPGGQRLFAPRSE